MRLIAAAVLASVAVTSFRCSTGNTVKRLQTPASTLLDERIPESRRLAERNRLETESEYLKVHMRNGDLYVITRREAGSDSLGRYSPQIKLDERSILGFGDRFDGLRDVRQSGWFEVPLDSVVIMETNTTSQSGSVAALSLVTGISAALTVYCLSNTKACFGSCPTFYTLWGDSLHLSAEGFSSSIAPSLEARDVDALPMVQPRNNVVDIEMRNEALETHVVRYVNLLALEHSMDERVFKDVSDVFWIVKGLRGPISCSASEGGCLAAVRSEDGEERFTETDSTDLGAKETITVNFHAPSAERYGLVLRARQSLLSTYLLYQTFAYMGRDVGKWLAQLERNGGALYQSGLGKILGGIEVQVQNTEGVWETVEEAGEHGPLASDAFIIPLPKGADASTIRLRMTKGNWRLDYVGLAEMGADPVEPVRFLPSEVRRDNAEAPEVLQVLLSETESITTLPGDEYILRYELPDSLESAEFFLESRGYYLEWIRDEWVAEENPQRLMQILLTPSLALKTHAHDFKAVEAQMEDAFWRSRYAAQ